MMDILPPNPTAAIVVIGNEILSGRTQDTNVNFIALQLSSLGIDLIEVRIVPDEETAIIKSVNELRGIYDYVFTTGGIGATHDDITAAAIAKAFNVPLEQNIKALQILKNHYGNRFNEIRARMAMMPTTAILIDNPISQAPAFRIENVFVLAGMPKVMHGMFNALKPFLKRGLAWLSCSIKTNLLEGVIADDLSIIQDAYSTVVIGSYPFYEDADNIGTTLVARSRNENDLEQVRKALKAMITKFNGHVKEEKE